jgi:SAM-dependent methyltransferase
VTFAYADVIAELRDAYAVSADWRDQMSKYDWKLDERDAFLGRLRDEEAVRLLELGAGTGQDSVFFRDNGLDVVATDLTPEMVAHCVEKGLDAHVRDVLDLGLPADSFDAVWTINCLLHVPSDALPLALAEISRVLRPGGLLYVGVYSTEPPSEGLDAHDKHVPQRFFAFRTDDAMLAFVQQRFELIDFHTVPLPLPDSPRTFRFQSFTLRKH